MNTTTRRDPIQTAARRAAKTGQPVYIFGTYLRVVIQDRRPSWDRDLAGAFWTVNPDGSVTCAKRDLTTGQYIEE